MPAEGPYFDTSYLVRLYLDDHGSQQVRARAGACQSIASAWHAQAEVVAALHRVVRERRMEQEAFRSALDQFSQDCKAGLFLWLPLTDGIQRKLAQFFRDAPRTAFIRAADALHLACAVEYGCAEVYSHDRHFLAAAPLFELRGINIIPE